MLLISFILALGAVVVAKLVILGISFLTPFIVALKVVLVANLVISGILSSIFFMLALYTSFLQHRFLVHHLDYLNKQEQVLIYQHLNCLLLFSNCLNQLIHFLIYLYVIYLHQILSLLNQFF